MFSLVREWEWKAQIKATLQFRDESRGSPEWQGWLVNSPPLSRPKKIEQNGVLYSGRIVLVISIFKLKLMQNTNLPHQSTPSSEIYMIWILQCLVFCECDYHCVKSARIRSYSGPPFHASGLNADQNNSEYGQFLGRVHHVFYDGECIVFLCEREQNAHLCELSCGLWRPFHHIV